MDQWWCLTPRCPWCKKKPFWMKGLKPSKNNHSFILILFLTRFVWVETQFKSSFYAYNCEAIQPSTNLWYVLY